MRSTRRQSGGAKGCSIGLDPCFIATYELGLEPCGDYEIRMNGAGSFNDLVGAGDRCPALQSVSECTVMGVSTL